MILNTADIDSNAGAMIVRNIDVLQAALDYMNERMGDLFDGPVTAIFSEALKAEGWDGKAGETIMEGLWVASADWRVPREDADDRIDHLIWLEFYTSGEEHDPWVSIFAGSGERQVFLRLGTQIKQRALARAMANNPDVLVRLNSLDLHLDGDAFYLPIEFDREALANGFAEEDLTDAIAPLAAALRRVMDAKGLMKSLSGVIDSAMKPTPR